MNGAHEYAGLFKSAQYGNLYLLSHHHARGQTFQIFVVPEGFQIKPGELMRHMVVLRFMEFLVVTLVGLNFMVGFIKALGSKISTNL
ncbi:hypothetical protein B9T29_14495 [Acinetobacter sp. ANC 3903]|uniref:hypothetical protein n=1 Tax=Acinetobacter sp. ANC 3903 TaxID=1977883 RepID=UPI000A32D33A|nr:hypothetical protein [Acinetobacter sp. ANC 3903]OTG58039.1 hypothetical protein B9T29_14495 [Acinetobacter sp. ANC 3903]